MHKLLFAKFFDANTGSEGAQANPDTSGQDNGNQEQPGAHTEEDGSEGNDDDATITIKNSELQDRISRGVNAQLARQKQEQEAKDAENKAQKDYAKLTADQKRDVDLKKANDRIEELERQSTINSLKASVRADLLKELPNSGEFGEDVIGLLTTDKAETTKTNVNAFTKIVKETAQKLYQQDLQGAHTPGRAKTGDDKSHDKSIGVEMAEQVNKTLPKAAIDPWKLN